MDIGLTIFVALTFLVLAWNAVFLWFIWRALSRAKQRAQTRAAEHARTMEALRITARTAEQMSFRMASASGRVLSAVNDLDDAVGRADNWARYGLAKLDFNVDRASDRLTAKTRTLGSQIRDPLYHTAAAIHGVKALLNLIVRWKPGAHRVRQAARVLGPFDTATTVIQAVTAVGSLFSGRSSADSGTDTTSPDSSR